MALNEHRPYNKNDGYWKACRARAINDFDSDGCTNVTQIRRDACDEHDLHYRSGHHWDLDVAGILRPNFQLTRREADRRFRLVLYDMSKLGRCSPMGWWRWLGVRTLWAGKTWKKYRRTEPWSKVTDKFR